MQLGQAVAYQVESPELLAIRDDLAAAFTGSMVPQDQQRPRLHITIVNKVEVKHARAVANSLKAGFQPRALQIAGLAAWHYRGGPWELAVKASFRG